MTDEWSEGSVGDYYWRTRRADRWRPWCRWEYDVFHVSSSGYRHIAGGYATSRAAAGERIQFAALEHGTRHVHELDGEQRLTGYE